MAYIHVGDVENFSFHFSDGPFYEDFNARGGERDLCMKRMCDSVWWKFILFSYFSLKKTFPLPLLRRLAYFLHKIYGYLIYLSLFWPNKAEICCFWVLVRCVRAIEVVFFVGLKLGSGHKFSMSKRAKHLTLHNTIYECYKFNDDDGWWRWFWCRALENEKTVCIE